MTKRIFRLVHQTARNLAIEAIASSPDGYLVEIREPTRTLDQNAMLWDLLADISNQVMWHGVKLSPEEYKDLLSAGLAKSKVVPNIEGNGFVILGQRTSKMTKKMFADLLELVLAFGAERGVMWSGDALSQSVINAPTNQSRMAA